MDNDERVVLKSPEPFEGRHANGYFFLLMLIVPFSILGLGQMLFDPDSFMEIACMFIGAVSFLAIIVLYTLDYKATVKHMTEIRNMKFRLTYNATLENIYNKIEPALKNFHGEKVEISRETDHVAVIYDGIKYKIVLNNDATFSVHWQKSFLDKAFALFAWIADREGDAEPTWKYNKLRTETPIIAYELQHAFGITSTLKNKNTTSAEQTTQKIPNRVEHSTENANIAENRREQTENTSILSRNKKIIAVSLVVVAGFLIILAGYSKSTPKTVDEFITKYNTEIKRTAGKILEDKYRGQGMLVEYCTLNDVKIDEGGKFQILYDKSIRFMGYEGFSIGPDDRPIEINFNFNLDSAPVNAIVAIIDATISAAGDDEEKVTKALEISKENNYAVPYGQKRHAIIDNREYSITYSGTNINFSVIIHNKQAKIATTRTRERILGTYAAKLDDNRAARLLLSGYWKGENDFDLNISTDKITELTSKHYESVGEFLYSVISVNEDSDTIVVEAELIHGADAVPVNFVFKDLNNMVLINRLTDETLNYSAQNYPYPQHLDNNLQYVLLHGRMGIGFYMDLSTLQIVDDHNWNVDVISANMDNNGQRGEIIHMKFFIKGQPFILDRNGEWNSIDVDNTAVTNMLRRNAFLTSYYYVFGRNYGSRF